MWDVKKYKAAINKIKELEMLGDKPVSTKEQIYDVLAGEIHVSHETVKSWTRTASNGPACDEDRNKVEELLCVPKGSLDSVYEEKTEAHDTCEDKTENLTDFNKEAILRCYKLMKGYLHDDRMESEECLVEMTTAIEMEQIAVPKELYGRISDFISDHLHPIVYEPETVYRDCYTDEIGFWNKKGAWQIRDEDAARKMSMAFVIKNLEIEEALDRFAMEEMYPYLL